MPLAGAFRKTLEAIKFHGGWKKKQSFIKLEPLKCMESSNYSIDGFIFILWSICGYTKLYAHWITKIIEKLIKYLLAKEFYLTTSHQEEA